MHWVANGSNPLRKHLENSTFRGVFGPKPRGNVKDGKQSKTAVFVKKPQNLRNQPWVVVVLTVFTISRKNRKNLRKVQNVKLKFDVVVVKS